MPSWQVAPPKHGCGEHSFTFIRQSGPENPCAHKQRNQPGPDSHVPPLWHGWPWHWSNGSEQNDPPHPLAQRHCEFSPPIADDVIHEPPFKHWPGKHCVTLSVHILPANTKKIRKTFYNFKLCSCQQGFLVEMDFVFFFSFAFSCDILIKLYMQDGMMHGIQEQLDQNLKKYYLTNQRCIHSWIHQHHQYISHRYDMDLVCIRWGL